MRNALALIQAAARWLMAAIVVLIAAVVDLDAPDTMLSGEPQRNADTIPHGNGSGIGS